MNTNFNQRALPNIKIYKFYIFCTKVLFEQPIDLNF